MTLKVDSYEVQVASAADYYPFGWEMPGRKYNSQNYRYGFNGKEKDQDGEFGSITNYDYGFRIYNPAIGKFLSVDPLTSSYPQLTPYQFASNTPISGIDLDGLELITMHSADFTEQFQELEIKLNNDKAVINQLEKFAKKYGKDHGGYFDEGSRQHAIEFYESQGHVIVEENPYGPLTVYGYTNAADGDVYRILLYQSTEIAELAVIIEDPSGKSYDPPGPPGALLTIVDPIMKAGRLAEDIGNNPGILAFEIGAQVSFNNITFGRSAYFASDGTSFGTNGGAEFTTDRSFSFSINFNALVAKDRRTSLVGTHFGGLEDNVTVDIQTPYGFSVGANGKYKPCCDTTSQNQ